MRTVHRFTVPVDDQPHPLVASFDGTGLPDSAAGRSCIVHVACRLLGEVEVWVQVDTEADEREWMVAVTGTGNPVPDGAVHVGTALGPINDVWHLWRIPS